MLTHRMVEYVYIVTVCKRWMRRWCGDGHVCLGHSSQVPQPTLSSQLENLTGVTQTERGGHKVFDCEQSALSWGPESPQTSSLI